MNTLVFFSLLVLISTAFLAQAHSDKHVQRLCGRKAIENIMNLCPSEESKCQTGEFPSVTEYCAMGFSDSQIKFICCPEAEAH